MIKTIYFNTDDVISSLSIVASVVNAKNSMPILDNIVFSRLKDEACIMASDGDVWVKKSISVDNESDNGIRICVNAKSFVQALSNLSGKRVRMDIDDEKMSIRCDYGCGHFSLPYASDDAFPFPKDIIDGVNKINIVSSAFMNAIGRVNYACANDEIRLVLTGVNVSMSPTGLETASTDGRTLARYTDSSITVDGNFSFILPRKPSTLLGKLLNEGNEDAVTIESNERMARFTTDTFCISTRLIEGRFPNYNAVIPNDNHNIVEVRKDLLLSAVKRISLMTDNNTQLVVLSVSGNKLELSCEDVDYQRSATEWVDCKHDGEDIKIGFSASKLLTIIQGVQGDDVRIELKNAMSAGAFMETTTSDYISILMPLKTN